MLLDAAWYLVVGATWITVAIWLRDWPARWHEPAVRSYCITMLSLAVELTLMAPPVYEAVDAATGVGNISWLLATSLAVFHARAFQPTVWYILRLREGDRGFRSSRNLAVGVGVISAVLFLLAPVDKSEPRGFLSTYGAAPFVAEHIAVWGGYMLVMLWQCLTGCLMVLERARGRATRLEVMRFRLHTLGWVFIILAIVHMITQPVLLRIGITYTKGNILAGALLGSGVGLLIVAELLKTLAELAMYVSVRRLRPLHGAMVRATGLAMIPISGFSGTGLTVKGVATLRRQVIDIFDAEVELRRYCDAQVAEQVQRRCELMGITREEMDATVDAACLAVAMRARARGEVATRPRRSLVRATGQHEISYLVKVSEEFQRSPIVAEIVASVETEQTQTV